MSITESWIRHPCERWRLKIKICKNLHSEKPISSVKKSERIFAWKWKKENFLKSDLTVNVFTIILQGTLKKNLPQYSPEIFLTKTLQLFFRISDRIFSFKVQKVRKRSLEKFFNKFSNFSYFKGWFGESIGWVCQNLKIKSWSLKI